MPAKSRIPGWRRALPVVTLSLAVLCAGLSEKAFSSRETGRTEGGEEAMVLGLSFLGLYRAYPIQHFPTPRVLNDEIQDQEIAIFHDPGQGVSAAYFRMVLGEPIEFSGTVRGTVADDITTITRWDMASGKAVGGNLIGMELIPLPVSRTSWAEWFASHPDTSVFSSR